MDFFSKFKQLYNFAKSAENMEEFQSSIDDQAWYDFQEKSSSYDLEKFEILYRVIVHYHYVETKFLENYPYKLKLYKGDGNGVTFEPKNLPLCLQYILLNWY